MASLAHLENDRSSSQWHPHPKNPRLIVEMKGAVVKDAVCLASSGVLAIGNVLNDSSWQPAILRAEFSRWAKTRAEKHDHGGRTFGGVGCNLRCSYSTPTRIFHFVNPDIEKWPSLSKLGWSSCGSLTR